MDDERRLAAQRFIADCQQKYGDYSVNTETAIEFAEAMHALCDELDGGLAAISAGAEQLDLLYQAHPESLDLASHLMGGLENLFDMTDDPGQKAALARKMRAVYNAHQANRPWAGSVAGILGWAEMNTAADPLTAFNSLSELYDQNKDCQSAREKIGLIMAHSGGCRDEKAAFANAERMRAFCDRHADDLIGAVCYCCALCQTIDSQNAAAAVATLSRLKDFYKDHSNDETAAYMAAGLAALFEKQPLDNRDSILCQLADLYESNPRNKSIAHYYYKCLAASFAGLDDPAACLAQLDNLHHDWPDLTA